RAIRGALAAIDVAARCRRAGRERGGGGRTGVRADASPGAAGAPRARLRAAGPDHHARPFAVDARTRHRAVALLARDAGAEEPAAPEARRDRSHRARRLRRELARA